MNCWFTESQWASLQNGMVQYSYNTWQDCLVRQTSYLISKPNFYIRIAQMESLDLFISLPNVLPLTTSSFAFSPFLIWLIVLLKIYIWKWLIEVVMVQALTDFNTVRFVKMPDNQPVNNKLPFPSAYELELLINQYLILCYTLEVTKKCDTFHTSQIS